MYLELSEQILTVFHSKSLYLSLSSGVGIQDHQTRFLTQAYYYVNSRQPHYILHKSLQEFSQPAPWTSYVCGPKHPCSHSSEKLVDRDLLVSAVYRSQICSQCSRLRESRFHSNGRWIVSQSRISVFQELDWWVILRLILLFYQVLLLFGVDWLQVL